VVPLKILNDLLSTMEDGRRRIEIHHLSHPKSDHFPLLVNNDSSPHHLSYPIGRRTKSEWL